MKNLNHTKKIAIITIIAGSPALGQQVDLNNGPAISSDPRPKEVDATHSPTEQLYNCDVFTSLEGFKNAPDGSMVYYDVSVAAWPLEVQRIYQHITTASGTPYQFEVYTTPDSVGGKWLDPTQWTLQASGNGISQGHNTMSNSILTNSFTLDANTSYGMGIYITGAGHRYHNGNGTNEIYENDFLRLKMGLISFGAFDPSAFSPRIWNGVIEYVSPTCACPCACDWEPNHAGTICEIFDFLNFQNAFVNGETCACDIDISTGIGVCDIFDFLAFQNEFVSGCL